MGVREAHEIRFSERKVGEYGPPPLPFDPRHSLCDLANPGATVGRVLKRLDDCGLPIVLQPEMDVGRFSARGVVPDSAVGVQIGVDAAKADGPGQQDFGRRCVQDGIS